MPEIWTSMYRYAKNLDILFSRSQYNSLCTSIGTGAPNVPTTFNPRNSSSPVIVCLAISHSCRGRCTVSREHIDAGRYVGDERLPAGSFKALSVSLEDTPRVCALVGDVLRHAGGE